ncbi:MAG: DEAD/DEAH box helicase [Bacteroidota bacterium]
MNIFTEKLSKQLAQSLLENKFEEPLELQSIAIRKINSGTDVIVEAPVNTGKSTTIVISTIQKLQSAFEDAARALIIVANKEDAISMKEQFSVLAKHTNLRVHAAHEGDKIDKQAEAIYFGADVVIGTPVRILELYFKKNLNINKVKLFALDNAEMMIKNSNQGQIDRLALSLPKCQHLVFTTAYDAKVERLIEKFIVAPAMIEMEG